MLRQITQRFADLRNRVLLVLCLFSSPAIYAWQPLAPGIDYLNLNINPLTPWSHIHVFRVDLKQNQVDLATANELSKAHASVDEIAHANRALIAINGGFFDQHFHPLGLRVKNHYTLSPLKQISWWGVFYIQNSIPYITSANAYNPSPDIKVAVQSGPRLIINGHIPTLKPGIAERTALGITKQNQLIILVTDNYLLTTTELARILKKSPLNCVNALNLDGGSSSQLFAQLGYFKINVHGFSNISDAIVIKRKYRAQKTITIKQPLPH